jgi:ABC-type branched-subunit amino acid transport system substrate-binding protein
MRILTNAVTLAVVAMLATAAKAQDAYVIGLTGALTGPLASTTASSVEGLRIYIDRVNAAGGINGKPIKLRTLDDQADAQQAAANARQLLTQDNAILLIDSSLSSTYAPVIAEAKHADVPLMYVGAVCPKEVYPPAESGQFCTSAFASNLDSSAALSFIKNTATDRVHIGLAGMTIPISRAEVDFAESQAGTLGMTVVDKEIIPPATTDYAPFATKLQAAKPNWVYAWAPWVTQLRTYEALRGLGWQGSFLTWAHQEAEDELKRRKDPALYVIGANALFQDGLPVQKEIAAASPRRAANTPQAR